MGVVWAMSFPALVVLLFALAIFEVWGRRFLPWHRRGQGRRMASSVAMEELVAGMYGTKRYELEQRQVDVMLVQHEEDGAPPRTRVDLDAGKVVIHPPTAEGRKVS